ncbi:pilus assembly protein MshP [Alkalilimnicola sp. S0819]|uniref:pilus assembly protein MshP n=1 Tax=Alkalilimnicola sp. S0819 TaxID=2613922 RepID=UPI0012623F1A|nr:pilus assembly protein MshP [Alkalilimnicola sp. S0819]KAB7622630.1 pilus assembly protein MshP [Alkalilimnicola sp. S0819]MPQ17401.1 pilus assembly protein MshP [Alkalilimnicola sp. S0819]
MRDPQGGFSLVSAIFIIVVLSALGVGVVRVSTSEVVASASHLQGARAYYAARAGLEWGRHRAVNASQCDAASTLNVENFTVRVSCTAQVYQDPQPFTLYWLRATAEQGALDGTRQDLVRRTVRANVLPP